MFKDNVQEFDVKFYELASLKDRFNYYWENKVLIETHSPHKNVKYIQILLETAIEQKDQDIEHLLYIFQGYLFKKDGYYDKALHLYYKSKNYFFITEHKSYYAKVISDISVIFATLGLYNQACYLWKDLLRNYIDKDNIFQKGIVLNNLISTSISSYQNFDQVETILNDLLKEVKEANYQDAYYYNFVYCNSMVNLGYFHFMKFNDYKKALTFYEKALDVVNDIHDLGSKYEIYIKIADCYKGLNEEAKRINHLLKALKTLNNCENNISCLYMYKELYHYYKSKDDMKNALLYLEIVNALELNKKDQESKINTIIENIRMVSKDENHTSFLNEFSKKHVFNFNREVFLENIKGVVVKINLDEIVSIESYSKMIKIRFTNQTNHIYKATMREFSDLIHEKFGEDHLFFNTNLRSEMVNLFWMSKYDKLNKKLYINVLGEETVFELTRGQSIILKDFFNQK